MSRRDEVESEMKEALRGCDDGMEYAERLEDKCLLLADEVHAERAVVTKLLAMLNEYAVPGGKLYTRACEIAGRRE